MTDTKKGHFHCDTTCVGHGHIVRFVGRTETIVSSGTTIAGDELGSASIPVASWGTTLAVNSSFCSTCVKGGACMNGRACGCIRAPVLDGACSFDDTTCLSSAGFDSDAFGSNDDVGNYSGCHKLKNFAWLHQLL